MSFQTSKSFVHLQNTNEDLFDEKDHHSVPPLTAFATTTLTLQKVNKEIGKLLHMNRVV